MFSILHLVHIWYDRPKMKMVRRKTGRGGSLQFLPFGDTSLKAQDKKQERLLWTLSRRVGRMFTSTYLVATYQIFLNICLEANTTFYDLFVTSCWIYMQSPWSLRSKRMWTVWPTGELNKEDAKAGRQHSSLYKYAHTEQQRGEQGREICDGE